MSDLVSDFNSLARLSHISDKIPNDWVFTVRHVPVEPEADLIMLVNPTTLESHCEGPIDLSKLDSRDVSAVISHCLLKAFVTGMGSGDQQQKIAPWTLKTTDAKLAREVQEVMVVMGVKEDRREIGVADDKVKKLVDGQWEDLLGTIQRSMA
ncbi:hypothetical protein DXG03_004153 [Asterophora parasitica]|uniref:Uncharacterized protein n=1 Tax=Asterophora parasitica TaxID=117018 RepID=A0A9P7G2N2_9AGAR|nr:hypothetical protein DXG03_004153 [Asterophora parasitica]